LESLAELAEVAWWAWPASAVAVQGPGVVDDDDARELGEVA